MKGMDFVVDDKGQKKAVVLDLKKYGRLLEDFVDGVVATSRKNEPEISLAQLKKQLHKANK